MSGTPMKDGPEEIASIMNLILPSDKQLPMEQEFLNTFMNKVADNLYDIKPEKIVELSDCFRGRVSYLKNIVPNITKTFVGSVVKPLKYFKVDINEMSEFQTKYYLEALQRDENEMTGSGWYNHSRQASLFVFPDGTYGKEGFTKYVKITKNNDKTSSFSLSSHLEKVLLVDGNTNEAIIKNIMKYSSKYGRTIQEILRAKKGITLIYNEFVEGSGIILFSLLLNLFGYRKSNGSENDSAKRYALLTHKTTTIKRMSRLLDKINSSENVTGNIINVIIKFLCYNMLA